MKKQLEKLNAIVNLNSFSIDKLNSSQNKKFNDLKIDISNRLNEIGALINRLPNNKEKKEISDELVELRLSDLDILLQRSSGITSLISFLVLLMQIY